MLSSLSRQFSDNILRGSSPVKVFEDKVYQINPNNMFRSPESVKYIGYPKFDRSYTWRDSRLVSLDANGDVIGLGGARNPGDPNSVTIINDWTSNVDSPWVPSDPTPTPSGINVTDEGDFRGARKRDHDPIALPLLVDFLVFPDGTANQVASGANGFQVAMLGPPSAFSGAPPSPGGYYNFVGSGCPQADPWPFVRVHTSGSEEPATLDPRRVIIVDPANTPVALGGFHKDAGAIIMAPGSPFSATTAYVQVPPGDGMLHWARADFVRKVSTITYGFFDTMQPNRRADPALPGYPDFLGSGSSGEMRISEFVSLLDPPLSRQPSGTSVVLEIRCADNFPRSGEIYDSRLFVPTTNTPETPSNRGNLLNPSYACEAYRYDQPNSGVSFTDPRVDATGLTRYVTEDRLSTISNPLTGLLPRFMNLRLSMTNNVTVTPALSPSLRSMGVVYRMRPAN
jgi:hypothetical protein